MKLSIAQKTTIKLVRPSVILGTLTGFALLFGFCILADLTEVTDLLYFVIFPAVGALLGGMIGSIPFVVSTIIAMFLEQ